MKYETLRKKLLSYCYEISRMHNGLICLNYIVHRTWDKSDMELFWSNWKTTLQRARRNRLQREKNDILQTLCGTSAAAARRDMGI